MLSDNLILANKPYGATPLESTEALRCIGILGETEKATYAGRLDPLATGLLVILKGEGVHEKNSFLDLPKIYQIEIVFGVETDTGDLLGVPHANACTPPTLQEIAHCLESTTENSYPMFSSKTVQGKPLHEYAREGISVAPPSRKVQYRIIKQAILTSVTARELVLQAQYACEIVKGDFRQELISQAWQEAILPIELPRYAYTLEVTSGTYMRAIPEILKRNFGAISVITKIHRTHVGDLSLS